MDSDNHIGVIVEQEDSHKYTVWTENLGPICITSNPDKPVNIGDFIVKTNENYDVIPQVYKTNYNDQTKTLEVYFDYHLDFYQSNHKVEHNFFGSINISNNIHTKEGKWMITIQYLHNSWILTEISEHIEPSNFDTISIIGITVSKNHVWCRERAPGNDIWVRSCELPPIGTWIRMEFSSEDHFRNNLYPKPISFEAIPPVYSIYESKRTIEMSLDCYVDRSDRITDIFHPAVGLILNKEKTFPSTGKYNIVIRRAKKQLGDDGRTYSVWFLMKITILTEVISSKAIETVPRFKPIESLQTQGARSSYSSTSVQGLKLALITKIVKREDSYEEVYFCTLDDHKSGKMVLWNKSEVLGFALGGVFGGKPENFSWKPHLAKYEYSSDEYTHCGDYKNIGCRVRYGAVEVHIFTDKYFHPTQSCRYSTLIHEDFGTVLDNRDLLARTGNMNLTIHCWIRRCQVDGNHCWVVTEKIENIPQTK